MEYLWNILFSSPLHLKLGTHNLDPKIQYVNIQYEIDGADETRNMNPKVQ